MSMLYTFWSPCMCVYVCPFSSLSGYLSDESLPCVTLDTGHLEVNQVASAA